MALRARRRRLQPEEWLEWGQLLEVILPAGRVQALLQTAVAQMPGNADLRVIGLTGHLSPETERTLLDAGAECCLTKPVDMPRLLRQLGLDA